MLRIEKYGRTRHWALWDGDVLVAVMVYKKGAEAVRQRLSGQPASPACQAARPARRSRRDQRERPRASGRQAPRPFPLVGQGPAIPPGADALGAASEPARSRAA